MELAPGQQAEQSLPWKHACWLSGNGGEMREEQTQGKTPHQEQKRRWPQGFGVRSHGLVPHHLEKRQGRKGGLED